MKLFAHTAFVDNQWKKDVVVTIEQGYITSVDVGAKAPSAGVERIQGVLIPGIPNLHSHAFQRAFAGLAELRQNGIAQDNFWSWRSTMYEFAKRLTPDQVGIIAEQLYIEMLKSGYTSVAEFHYLHHTQKGKPYKNVTVMSDQVISAAKTTGIAITHLPVLYCYGGFGQRKPSSEQLRFANDVDNYAKIIDSLTTRFKGDMDVKIGCALHSLRAIDNGLLRNSIELTNQYSDDLPIHIHIAEQEKEVSDCLISSGSRPVEWLFERADIGRRWSLIHSTHICEEELNLIASSECVVGLCPSTEANLGDGIFPAAEFIELGGLFGVGSDSQITINPFDELRILEYGQRLKHQKRAMVASYKETSIGESLITRALKGGAQSLGIEAGAIAVGKRADLVVLDDEIPALVEKPLEQLFDCLIFAGTNGAVKDVMTAGIWRVKDRRHEREEQTLLAFKRLMKTLTTVV